MERIGVWHRDDLRVRDNKALSVASIDGEISPMFIFDPGFYNSSLVSDGRIDFMHESLDQLDKEYSDMGSSMSYLHGEPQDVIKYLFSEDILDKVYFNSTVTAGHARERDEKISSMQGVRVFSDDAIVRVEESRDRWREQAQSYFEDKVLSKPEEPKTFEIESEVTIDKIDDKYSVSSDMKRRHKGGCMEARDRLEDFVENISEYIGGISPPSKAEKRTSQLSPYIKFGCISPRQAYKYAEDNADNGRAKEMFTSRLFWNRHFTQKLQDNPNLRKQAVNPVFRGMNRSTHKEKYHEKWKDGLTGYPMVDASMRALNQTGWMNFRMRAMCSSFYTYILRCWWKEGADWFYKKLIDADPAINYAQWQMQSGLIGVHPLRIYNPMKQVRENDPDGEYIKKYVPELRDLPAKYLDQPEKTPLSVQEENGVIIGDDYPYPVVDYEKRRDEARDYWRSLDGRAKEALEDPEVFRKASLSRDSRQDLEGSEIDTTAGSDDQKEITDF